MKIKTTFTFILKSSGFLVKFISLTKAMAKLRSSNFTVEPEKIFAAEDFSSSDAIVGAEKRMKCNQCNYASSYVGHLKVHMRMHEKAKSKQSKQCGPSSSESSSLGRENTDKGSEAEKTYKCNPCNYWCTGADRMRMHMKSHNRSKSMFDCTLCNYASASARDMRGHTIAAHRSLFDNSPSVTGSGKKKHAKRISGEKPNQCNRCDYASSCGSNLKAHIFFYHFCYFVSGQSLFGVTAAETDDRVE